MNVKIRKSDINDFNFLVKLEEESFPAFQRSTKQSIKHGIQSEFQEILILETINKNKLKVGALVLFKYSKSLRIYSIAIFARISKYGLWGLST